jgi:lysophospholipid acyltransferase
VACRTVKGPAAPRLVFAVTLAHLSLSHIFRMLVDYGGWQLDYTGPQMVLVIKLTSFAYNLYDGTRLDKVRASAGMT